MLWCPFFFYLGPHPLIRKAGSAPEQVCSKYRYIQCFVDLSSSIKPDYTPAPKVPSEPPGDGLNKQVYFVCNDCKYQEIIIITVIEYNT